ncbi:MAG TPA: ATP-binding protein [Pseudomonas xinjiangensis]|uniref:ATP-binding protein n=2 Tax=root TaxID=1 RepID=A0A7V1FRG6_9GAMM|nr:ATP-binding protein [Halopseudomonas xinjiangensis]HEC49059.1 ATP-binding protein [Halopseudomonas xinjiangensis]
MGIVHLVFGPQGAGKSTYSRTLSESENGTRFSIDEWMVQLYGPDLPKPMNLSWIMERVRRCEAQIWSIARAVALNGGSVILDLGFMKATSRTEFAVLARESGLEYRMHYLHAPHDVRRNRVLTRNAHKGVTFSLEVTPMMFDFMEKQFEPPSHMELSGVITINTDVSA